MPFACLILQVDDKFSCDLQQCRTHEFGEPGIWNSRVRRARNAEPASSLSEKCRCPLYSSPSRMELSCIVGVGLFINYIQGPLLLVKNNRKLLFGNAVSPLERGTPISDNQESFSARLGKGKKGSVSSVSYGSSQLMTPYCTRGKDLEF